MHVYIVFLIPARTEKKKTSLLNAYIYTHVFIMILRYSAEDNSTMSLYRADRSENNDNNKKPTA